MIHSHSACIGHWYLSNNGTNYFEVVAIDEHARTIEIQYVDGEITEYDMESWQQLNPQLASPPEDPAAPFEDATTESATETRNTPEDWRNAIDDMGASGLEPFDEN